MVALVVLGGLSLVVLLTSRSWAVSIPILVGILVAGIWLAFKSHSSRMHKKKELSEHMRRQSEIYDHVRTLVAQAETLNHEAIRNAWDADAALDQAEVEFADGAFAPFWDEIEAAANCLARVDEAVREIASVSEHYWDHTAKLDEPPPPLMIDPSSLPDIEGIAERLQSVVCPAQRDFQFATIFEQRKTNQLLVNGFGTLAWAIAEISDRLSRSLSVQRKVHNR